MLKVTKGFLTGRFMRKQETVQKKERTPIEKNSVVEPYKGSLEAIKDRSPKTIGEIFQAVRETRKLELDSVSQVLRISKRYLQAIEEMDIDKLPEQVYVLGFVRSYAQYLGVDPQKSVVQFKKELFEGVAPNNTLTFPEPLKTPFLPTKRTLFMSATILGLVIGGGIFLLPGGKERKSFQEIASFKEEQESVPLVPAPLIPVIETLQEVSPAQERVLEEEKLQPVHTTDNTTSVTEGAALPSEDPNKPTILSFDFTDETWFKLKDSQGKVLISKIFKAGESYPIEMQPGMTFETGNAGGIIVHTANIAYKIGGKGQVLHGYPVNPENFTKIQH